MSELETANQRIAELEARVQELGEMARDVNSRRVVELEAELAAIRAGGEPPKWWFQQHPAELPDGEVVNYSLLPGDFEDGWTEQPLYTHPKPATHMQELAAYRLTAENLQRENAALQADKARLDWLADRDNHIGNVQLPMACVEANIESLRGAIDMAMGAGAKA